MVSGNFNSFFLSHTISLHYIGKTKDDKILQRKNNLLARMCEIIT